MFLGQVRGVHKEKKLHDLMHPVLIQHEWFNIPTDQLQLLKLILE